jgi:hypothetical protein
VIDIFFFLSLYFAFIFLFVFCSSLYFAFTQIATDARSNKHAHVTMGYFEFLWMFEVEVLFVHCLDNVF